MHREMRRKDRLLPADKTMEILQICPWGVLSTADADGQPYGVPVNYVVIDGTIYIHCAKTGHKLDNIRANSRVSFCAVSKAATLAADFSTDFASVIAFGTAREADGDEKIRALKGFIEKFSPEHAAAGEAMIQRMQAVTQVIRIDVDHITGKARKQP